MSLEDALNRNSDLLETHNALLEQVLGKAAGGGATTATASDSSKGGAKGRNTKKADEKKTDDGSTEGVTFADLRAKLSGWLGEFAKDEDQANPAGAHPEVQARRDALKKVLTTLKVKQLPEVDGDDEKISKLDTWFETKAKVADKGFGVGRLAADPDEEASDAEDDGMGI